MTVTDDPAVRSRWLAPPREWSLWKRPRKWVAYTLCTEAVTLGLVAVAIALVPISGDQFAIFGVLAVLGMLQAEASRSIERIRRTLSVTPYVNMTSIWLLPSALLLPPQLIALLGVVLYLHLGIRAWSGIRHVAAHRTATNATTMILSSLAGSLAASLVPGDGVLISEHGALAICAAAVAFFLTNTAITGVGLYLAAPVRPSMADILGSWDDNLLELSTLCLGGLLALTLVHQPVLCVVIFVPIFVLQRSVLAKQLEELATTDQKTQLLNAVSWNHAGEREVSRARRDGSSIGALMIDLDFFKKINDSHGHLAGDDVLKAVAATVKAETRAHDLAGRFGGEEFVVLLTKATQLEAELAAERIRMLLTQLVVHTRNNDAEPVVIDYLTASIGVAAFPANGGTLDQVLAAADAAVYAAKRSGRNKVVGAHILEAAATPG